MDPIHEAIFIVTATGAVVVVVVLCAHSDAVVEGDDRALQHVHSRKEALSGVLKPAAADVDEVVLVGISQQGIPGQPDRCGQVSCIGNAL